MKQFLYLFSVVFLVAAVVCGVQSYKTSKPELGEQLLSSSITATKNLINTLEAEKEISDIFQQLHGRPSMRTSEVRRLEKLKKELSETQIPKLNKMKADRTYKTRMLALIAGACLFVSIMAWLVGTNQRK